MLWSVFSVLTLISSSVDGTASSFKNATIRSSDNLSKSACVSEPSLRAFLACVYRGSNLAQDSSVYADSSFNVLSTFEIALSQPLKFKASNPSTVNVIVSVFPNTSVQDTLYVPFCVNSFW